MNWGTIRRWRQAVILGCALLSAPLIFAQVSSYGDKQMGENTGDQLPQVLKKVAVDQHLNQQLPLNATFVDETGKVVKLGDYFGKHPVILSLVYYNCPMLCSEELDGLASALEMVKLTPGKDFEIVVISFDPSETPAMAAKKKAVSTIESRLGALRRDFEALQGDIKGLAGDVSVAASERAALFHDTAARAYRISDA